ncbi:MAG: hypothetical protein ACQCN4_00095 [Candidatus Bathyarchaeia archaeon]|jgi:hypothetical protein
MPKKNETEKNEQIRAIFVLGLLAVLASIRTQNATIMASMGNQEPFNIIGIIDVMILLMSFYALFMIFGYSKDMVGESIADSFKHLARAFLVMNFALLVGIGFILGLAYYQSRLLWFFVVISVPIGYATFLKIKELKIKRTVNSKEGKKSIAFLAVSLGLGFSMLEIGYYSPEQYVPIFVATAIFCIVILIYFSNKEKLKQKAAA